MIREGSNRAGGFTRPAELEEHDRQDVARDSMTIGQPVELAGNAQPARGENLFELLCRQAAQAQGEVRGGTHDVERVPKTDLLHLVEVGGVAQRSTVDGTNVGDELAPIILVFRPAGVEAVQIDVLGARGAGDVPRPTAIGSLLGAEILVERLVGAAIDEAEIRCEVFRRDRGGAAAARRYGCRPQRLRRGQ